MKRQPKWPVAGALQSKSSRLGLLRISDGKWQLVWFERFNQPEVASCCAASVAYGNPCVRPVACVQAMVVVQEGNAELLRNSDCWCTLGSAREGSNYFGAVLEADGHGLKSCHGRAKPSTIRPNHIKAPSCFQVV